jgi:hypothetical protein
MLHKLHACAAVMQATERQDVRLYYGTHSEAMTPFQQEAAEWEGVQLVNVYSTDGKGYVQVSCYIGDIELGLAKGAQSIVAHSGRDDSAEHDLQAIVANMCLHVWPSGVSGAAYGCPSCAPSWCEAASF